MRQVYSSKRDGWIVILLWVGVASPACSLDRLQIRYGKSRLGMMISPQDKAGFLRDLVARSPGLKLDGDRVLRDKP